MTATARVIVLSLGFGLLMSSTALAQQGWGQPPGKGGAMPPGFGGSGGDADAVNLGALGGAGFAEGAKIKVAGVFDGPGKAGGLAAGDVITKVDGRALQPTSNANRLGPIGNLLQAIEAAEASRRHRVLALTVERGGSERTLKIPMAHLGKHSRTCPKKCKKCAKVVKAGLTYLARTQAGDGSFPTKLGGKTGMVVVTSLGGLAFLAAGASPSSGPLAKATQYVLSHAGAQDKSPFGNMRGAGGAGGNWNQENWEEGYALMFLAEMARRTRRPDLKQKCAELVAKLNENQEQSGGWGHGPGGPNALGYVELEIVSNYALLGMGAARRLGLDLDEGRVKKALQWIIGTSSGDGGVGYSHRAGQKGFGDPGRTAGAMVAFAALGQERHPFFNKMAGFFKRHLGELEGGHVSPAMHLLAGAMASKLLGRTAEKAYFKTYRLQIMGARKPDGSFAHTPTHESKAMHSNTDLQVGPRWLTATYVLILSLDNDRLPYLLGGKDKHSKSRRHHRVRTGS